MKMEQATTGKAPPSIAINSGGGIQLINMNAVQRGAVGATVVPSPGSAQKGTVVGSPGPPGNAVGVGPRMISITPQMLASRPGQPVDEQSDSGSVNPSDELNTSSGQSCSPASNTGVSCDLIAVNYDECEKGKIKDDDNGSENGFVKASDIHVEGNNRSNESQHGDENDLSLSTTPDGNSIEVSWPPKVVTERSVDSRCLNKSHPNSPSFHPEQSKTDCDENENNDCKLGSLGSNVQDNSKSSSSMPDEIGSSPIKDTSKLEQVDVIDVRERLSVIQGAQELVRVRVGSGKNGSSHKEESDLCVNESEVPIPINASNESEKVDSCQSEKSSNSNFFSIDSKDQQSQNCVQIEKMNLDVKLPLSCDNSEKSVLTVTSVKDQVTEAASVLNQESEPPPLVHDDKDSSAGNNNALTRGDSSSSVDPVESVDDVNLDMFADPLDAPVSEKSDDSKSKDANSTEENEESRPKLMDMNLADYMYMDFEDDDGGNNSWNQTRPSTVQHYSSSQQPLSQPKVSTSAAPSSSVASVSTEVSVTSSSNSGSSTWAVPRTAPQALEAPPSCAFQLYTVGQGQQGIRMQTANQAQIAARIPMGNEAFQQHIQSDPSKYPRPTYSAPTTVSASHSSRANITNPNTSFEYKANDSQSYFTTDPQLHSQFLQYTKNYPLPGVNKPEAVQHLSPGAMPVSHHVPSQQDLHAKQFPSARPLMVPQHHPSTQISSRNPLVQPQQRQVYPNQQYHHAVHQQSLQSQSHPTNPSYRANMNGCDVSKQAYNMAHVRPAFQSRSASGGQGQPPNLNIRPAPMTGVYPSVNVPSSNLHHVSHIQPQRHQLPKDMSSCTYATSGVMQQPSLPYTFTGTASSVSHPTNSVASTYPLVTGNYGQPASTGRHQASLVNHTTRASTLPAYQPSTTSSVQSRGNQYSPGATPPGWSVPIVVSNNNPLTSYSTNPNIRVSSQPASYQYSTQNLGARETTAFKPEVQTANRMPYTNTSSTMGAQQYRYPQSNYSSVNRPQVPQGPRMPSVITRYPSTGTQSACAKPDGGNAWNEINHYNSQQKQMMSSSMPSPQMLRNPHYIAQFRNPSSGIQQQDSSSVACQQSVIRPVSLNTSNLMSRSGTGANTQAMVGAQSGNISGNSQFYGNQQYQQMSSSASSSQQQPYYSNQASVIRAPQSSSSISSNSQVGSCSLAVKGVNHSGYHASSSGYSGDLTLQSFLSNPSAPFISPPSSSERSPSASGYGNENMGWGGERPCRDGGVSTEDYPLSSCQYSDAMRRYNAPSKGSSSKSKSNSLSNSLSASGANSALSGPGASPSSKSSIPSTSKSSKEKEKKDKTFSSSGYSADDDINDVAAMGGVNLAEETQKIMGSTEFVGTQIRSCRDETFIQASPIISKFKTIAAKYGLDETPSQDLTALLSHAVEERLKTLIEKLSVIAEHRMDVIKMDDRYEVTQDIKGQLRFLEELDKLERKRHDEQEREMLIRAAKSRSKSEDPEQAKLKAKAKEMQRVQLEEMRQRDANLTALQAIGPRKKPKLDTGGSHGSAVPSPLGASGASSSLGRQQMALRPRLKRVNLRDLLFLLEHDKETMRSPFLYRNLLLK